MRRVSIKEAKDVGKRLGMVKVVLVLVEEDDRCHVVTWGKQLPDCIGAAAMGNDIKRSLGWPDELCHAKPARQIRVERKAAQ